MFVGQYEHALDQKGRVVLPAPFRAFVAERGYVTKLDGCLGLWNEEIFREVAERWQSEVVAGRVSQKVFRNFLASVSHVKLDAAGRITLPRDLLDRLGFDTQVVITGRLDRVEIWPAEVYRSELESDDADAELAETIARLGL